MKPSDKISEFFSTIYGLSLFTIKSLYILISESMKKEARTYKEEREEQKRVARKRAKDASP
jgi:heme exporter protein D